MGSHATTSTPRPAQTSRHDHRLLFALVILGVIVAASVAAPLISPYSPIDPRPEESLLGPRWSHPAGTDLFGRDVMCRLLWGGRQSLAAAAVAVLLAVIPGTLLGLVSAHAGNPWDSALMRLVDVLLAFPALLLALAIIAWLGAGLGSATLAVGLAGIPRFARVMRSDALRLKSQPFVEAARAVGCTGWRTVWRHLLPNVTGSLLSLAALEAGMALLSIGGLGFLGLGSQPPNPEWGRMLAEGRLLLRTAPWVATFPGLAITVTVLATNLLADAVQERYLLRP